MAETWSAEKLRTYLREQYGTDAYSVTSQVNGWLERGDGVAVYENQDLGHPALGDPRLASYGSPAAILEVDEDGLPQRLPDTPKLINWRYQLKAVYRGKPLEVPS